MTFNLLEFYRTEARAESERVGRRLNALLSSQSFLIIAFAASMSASYDHAFQTFTIMLPLALVVLGLVLTSTAWPGICAAEDVVDQWRKKEHELLDRSPELDAYTIVSGDEASRRLVRRRYEGTHFARWAPMIFALAWICFATLVLGMYLGWLGA